MPVDSADSVFPEKSLTEAPPKLPVGRYHFGDFELVTSPLELRREGERQELAPQPARLLELLLANAGRVVSREEIRNSLWGEDVHVDHERGINFNIRQIRAVLGDDSSRPRFIETVPRQGYRFVASLSADRAPAPSRRRRGLVGPVLLLVLVTALVLWGLLQSDSGGPTQEGELAALKPEAAEQFRIGQRLLENPDPVERRKAKTAFERSLREEPDFAPTHAGLARANLYLRQEGEAKVAARRALELDSGMVDAHLVLAELAAYRTLETERPLHHLDRILELEAGRPEALTLKSWLLAGEGRTGEAVEVSRQLHEVDRMAWQGRWNLGWALFVDRRFEEAAEQFEETFQLYPRQGVEPHQLLIHSLIRLGRSGEALEAANRYLAAQESVAESVESLEEWWRFWLDGFRPLRDRLATQDYAQKAILHVNLGENREAVALLRQACEKRHALNLRFLRQDPRYDPLRLNPEFIEILGCLREGA